MIRKRLDILFIVAGAVLLLVESRNFIIPYLNQEGLLTGLSRQRNSKNLRNAPPSKEQLGQGGWTLIHTMAANYPEKPSTSDKRHARAFFQSLGALYPCKLCRDHFDRYIAVQPPEYGVHIPIL